MNNKKKMIVGVVGLGYVGLPLAVKFARAGFEVIGVDNDRKKLSSIASGKSYIGDVHDREMAEAVKTGEFRATADYDSLKDAGVICICVPTPLDKNKQPDVSYIRFATEKIKKILRKGQLVILESTTYPGTTEEILLPAFEEKGLKVGKDFYLVFSPERVDPGNKKYGISDIPKVIGGVTPECTRRAAAVYGKIFKQIFTVSSPRVAEIEKLLENIFRNVNIALVNELSMLCKKMGIDVWEVIAAAKTKPYGFMAFYPGPGIGGHCIPLDPFYLSWKAKEYDMRTRFIELAGEINDNMPEHVVALLQDQLNKKRKSLKGSKILVLGVAYKKDISDVRESPAIKVIDLLLAKGAEVSYHDPHVPEVPARGKVLRSIKLTRSDLKGSDCVLILTDHSDFDYEGIVRDAKLVFDTRNAVKMRSAKGGEVIKI